MAAVVTWARITRKHFRKTPKLPPPPRSGPSENGKSRMGLIRNRGGYFGIRGHLYGITAKRVPCRLAHGVTSHMTEKAGGQPGSAFLEWED